MFIGIDSGSPPHGGWKTRQSGIYCKARQKTVSEDVERTASLHTLAPSALRPVFLWVVSSMARSRFFLAGGKAADQVPRPAGEEYRLQPGGGPEEVVVDLDAVSRASGRRKDKCR
jgi:hypothetical protein